MFLDLLWYSMMVESLTALKGQPVAGIISCISGTTL